MIARERGALVPADDRRREQGRPVSRVLHQVSAIGLLLWALPLFVAAGQEDATDSVTVERDSTPPGSSATASSEPPRGGEGEGTSEASPMPPIRSIRSIRMPRSTKSFEDSVLSLPTATQ